MAYPYPKYSQVGLCDLNLIASTHFPFRCLCPSSTWAPWRTLASSHTARAWHSGEHWAYTPVIIRQCCCTAIKPRSASVPTALILSCTRWRTCGMSVVWFHTDHRLDVAGLAIWSRWSGGMDCGSTKASQRTWPRCACMRCRVTMVMRGSHVTCEVGNRVQDGVADV